MMTSAAQVLSALVDRPVTAGAASASTSEASLRVEDEWVATKTDMPALGISFVCRYPKSDLAKIVAVMVGAESDGEMDAMQLSIVAETVAQISTAMGEQLAQGVGSPTDGIASAVVADTGSFTAAAKKLGRDASIVSRRVSQLEQQLGASLLSRTTRRVALTEVGSRYYGRVQGILEELSNASREASDVAARPQGLLRVSVPLTFGR